VVGILKFQTLVLLALASPTAVADEPSRHDLAVGLDVGYVDVSGYESWTEGSVGKLRYAESGIALNRAFFDYEGRLTDTLDVTVVLEAYDDDLGAAVDFTEAYLECRPLPQSANRYRLKVGAFYPRVSLENVGRGWSSPYSMNASTINTWVAEELRSFGAELSWNRKPVSLGGAHEFSVNAAVFKGNDPAGSLLAWKGWSVHDRQSRFGDKLPLPPLPQIQPGQMFEAQDPYVEPFREIDDKAGYYLNAEWRYGKHLLIRAMFYDNKADPTSIISGQYGWYTEFGHLGLQTTLPGDVGLIAQWMSGSTVMGPQINAAHAVDVDYDSYFLLLTKAIGKHRVSARYDNFDMTQNDSTPEDSNPEHGIAWLASYQYGFTESLYLAVEWLSIKTHRYALVYYGLDPTVTERQLQLTLQLRF
jgi:hypothetical protein